MRKTLVILCMLAVLIMAPAAAFAEEKAGQSVSYGGYTYTVRALLPPFNEYFFVETDNPDPRTFRFEDKSSVYRSRPYILREKDSSGETVFYADINYDNEETGRVSGGYIFYGGGTDGGEVELEVSDNPDAYYQTWRDTGVKVVLPGLKSSRDYLIDTYADKSGFFENMNAVQSGLSDICLYSGSYLRGQLRKPYDYWLMSLSPHSDQIFYILSPYERDDDRPLFASFIYPYKLDSWGFPGMMESVAEALDSSAVCNWSSSSHDQVEVTYNGETRSYGGQGGHRGQSISRDKISRYFTFGNGSSEITLSGIKSLLIQYSSVTMEDDIPRQDALTWKQVADTAGSGAWARVSPGGKKPDSVEFAYVFKEGDGDTFDSDEFELGTSLYWGGDLGYANDAWVDGRYVDKWKGYVKGAKFEDHPTSSIIIKDLMVPQIPYRYSYEFNAETNKYEATYNVDGEITEEKRTVVFRYQNGVWVVWNLVFNDGCANYEVIADMASKGKISENYLDTVSLTADEVSAMGVDRNTNTAPDKGYIFDGTAAPGTPYDESQGHSFGPGKVEQEADCETSGRKVFKCLVCGETRTETIPAKGHSWGEASYSWSDDLSTVTAVRTCKNNSGHRESEISRTTREEIVKPSCESSGRIRYTAVFSNPAFTEAVKTVDVEPVGHKWGGCVITVKPTADTEGERVYTCENCGAEIKETVPTAVDDITPTMATANKAKLDDSVPKVDASKIKTTGSVSKKQLKITFPVNAAADNYLIQHRLAGTEDPANCWTAGKGSYTISGLGKNSLVQFRIIGFARLDDWSWVHGPWSDVSYRYMKSVTVKKLVPGKKKLTVRWSKDSNSTGYRILYSTKKSMSNAKVKKITGSGKTKYTIKKLKKGKKYYVRVMPVKTVNSRVYSGVLSAAKAAKVK